MDKQLLDDEIKQAMRTKDKTRLSILRMVKNEIDTKEKETGEPVSDADVVAVVKKVLKQTNETLDGSIKVGTDAERTALLEEQVAILEGYLPQQISGDELDAIIDRVMAEGGYTEKRDMGKVIGAVVEETGGNVRQGRGRQDRRRAVVLERLVHEQREQDRRHRAIDDHGVVERADARHDRHAQPARAHDRSQRRGADQDDEHRSHAGHDHRHRDGDLELAQPLLSCHAHPSARLDHRLRDALDPRDGVDHDRQDAEDHERDDHRLGAVAHERDEDRHESDRRDRLAEVGHPHDQVAEGPAHGAHDEESSQQAPR